MSINLLKSYNPELKLIGFDKWAVKYPEFIYEKRNYYEEDLKVLFVKSIPEEDLDDKIRVVSDVENDNLIVYVNSNVSMDEAMEFISGNLYFLKTFKERELLCHIMKQEITDIINRAINKLWTLIIPMSDVVTWKNLDNKIEVEIVNESILSSEHTFAQNAWYNDNNPVYNDTLNMVNRNVLKFYWKLIYEPKEILISTVLHEVAHILFVGHSKAFWELHTALCKEFNVIDNHDYLFNEYLYSPNKLTIKTTEDDSEEAPIVSNYITSIH